MAKVTFWTAASTQDLAIRELKRGIPEEIESKVSPSKVSDQRVVVTLSTEAEKWSGKAYATIKGQERNRAIHNVKVS